MKRGLLFIGVITLIVFGTVTKAYCLFDWITDIAKFVGGQVNEVSQASVAGLNLDKTFKDVGKMVKNYQQARAELKDVNEFAKDPDKAMQDMYQAMAEEIDMPDKKILTKIENYADESEGEIARLKRKTLADIKNNASFGDAIADQLDKSKIHVKAIEGSVSLDDPNYALIALQAENAKLSQQIVGLLVELTKKQSNRDTADEVARLKDLQENVKDSQAISESVKAMEEYQKKKGMGSYDPMWTFKKLKSVTDKPAPVIRPMVTSER